MAVCPPVVAVSLGAPAARAAVARRRGRIAAVARHWFLVGQPVSAGAFGSDRPSGARRALRPARIPTFLVSPSGRTTVSGPRSRRAGVRSGARTVRPPSRNNDSGEHGGDIRRECRSLRQRATGVAQNMARTLPLQRTRAAQDAARPTCSALRVRCVMPLSSTMVGKRTRRFRHEADARWLMAYAAALGERSASTSTRRGGIVAHPLFAVCVEWPVVLDGRNVEGSQTLTTEERGRGVHATHDLVITRRSEAETSSSRSES